MLMYNLMVRNLQPIAVGVGQTYSKRESLYRNTYNLKGGGETKTQKLFQGHRAEL